jgi:hypothetical protein
MKKLNIGSIVNIKACGIQGLITNNAYEVAYSDNDGNPCRGYFTPVELEQSNNSTNMGFKSKRCGDAVDKK